jgi:hypothetical protein
MFKPVAPRKAAEDPQVPDAYESAMSRLDEREKIFVRAVLTGATHEDAARKAGWVGDLSSVRVLGRVQVRDALETLAPLLPDEAESLRVLAPLLRARLVAGARGKQALAAIRDLLSLGASGPDLERARQEAWAKRQAERQAQRAAAGAG